ncbi:hypothetical protein F441_18856 [Phytophthora nicotianae CJ01A1]|uniref:Uncharacterized protein n=1 Tax=Phytophthora nicotianae CJ01A1 TaxID=1317063 RepID=W2W405_PHYNI|nr:hypothetical protein F441_18856 [Phytophthora nicotianae CJ01A1]
MSPRIAPDSTNANFCYAELFLHAPWRFLDELPKNDEECVAALIDAQEKSLGTELMQEANAKIARQYNRELLIQAGNVQVLQELPPSEFVFVSASMEAASDPAAMS